MANLSEPTALPRPPSRTLTPRQRAGVWTARVLSRMARVVPLKIAYAFSDRVGDLLYWRSPSYRRNVIENLRHVYRGDITEPLLRRQARRVFRTSSRNFWDLARVPYLHASTIDRIVTYGEHDLSLLDAARARGKGAVILTAHVGAFDFGGQLFYVKQYNPYTLTAPTVGEFVYAAVNELRLSQGAPLEDISPGAIRRMLRTLMSGGFVGLVADRDFTDNGSAVQFFDAVASLPTGPVRVARTTGAPIIPFIVLRNDGGRRERYTMYIREPFYVARTADEAQDVQQGLERMVEFLEWGISQAPEQWVMFQRVWTEDGARRRRWSTRTRTSRIRRATDDSSGVGGGHTSGLASAEQAVADVALETGTMTPATASIATGAGVRAEAVAQPVANADTGDGAGSAR